MKLARDGTLPKQCKPHRARKALDQEYRDKAAMRDLKKDLDRVSSELEGDKRDAESANQRAVDSLVRIDLLQTQRVGELERTTCLLRAKQKYADKIRSRSTPTRYEAEVREEANCNPRGRRIDTFSG